MAVAGTVVPFTTLWVTTHSVVMLVVRLAVTAGVAEELSRRALGSASPRDLKSYKARGRVFFFHVGEPFGGLGWMRRWGGREVGRGVK